MGFCTVYSQLGLVRCMHYRHTINPPYLIFAISKALQVQPHTRQTPTSSHAPTQSTHHQAAPPSGSSWHAGYALSSPGIEAQLSCLIHITRLLLILSYDLTTYIYQVGQGIL